MMKHSETPDLAEEMWLDKMSMITVISFTKSADKHRIQCDNWNGASFQLHTEVGTMKFKRSKEGPHHHKFSPEFIASIKNQGAQPLGTVEENATGRVNQQQDKAKEAQKLQHMVGAPVVQNFKHLIRSNQIGNCPVTVDNIETAEKICGKDITRRNPTAATTMMIAMSTELKEHNENVTLCINKMGFVKST